MKNLSNRVVLIGNLGSDPQVRQFENGRSLARLSVATTEAFKNKRGEWEDKTTWHTVIAWGPQAVFAERNLRKGSKIVVEGKLENRSYEDKEKVKRYVTEVVATDFMQIKKSTAATPSE